MSTTDSGAPRTYTKRQRDEAPVKSAKGGQPHLTTAQQHEYRVRDLQETIVHLEGRIVEQQLRFEGMFRRSEAMRNRQVDVINRLLKGGTMDEELLIAQEEIAALTASLQEMSVAAEKKDEQIADLEAQLTATLARGTFK